MFGVFGLTALESMCWLNCAVPLLFPLNNCCCCWMCTALIAAFRGR